MNYLYYLILHLLAPLCTQRLRLAKVNPDWLKTMEKEEKEAKNLKSKPNKKEEEEFETGNLSDTLTEVRRLAQKNLNDMDDTMEQVDVNLVRPNASLDLLTPTLGVCLIHPFFRNTIRWCSTYFVTFMSFYFGTFLVL
jgi:hypothetical protein